MRRWAGCLLVLSLSCAAHTTNRIPLPAATAPHIRAPLGVDPDPVQTPGLVNPGVTQANLAMTICKSGYTATIRPPQAYTTNLKTSQVPRYGYQDTIVAHYVEDHDVPLEVGGSPAAAKNLWPEPKTMTLPGGTVVSSKTKDAFEDYANFKVCRAKIRWTLAYAQGLFLHGWYEAYVAAGRPPDPYHHIASGAMAPAADEE